MQVGRAILGEFPSHRQSVRLWERKNCHCVQLVQTYHATSSAMKNWRVMRQKTVTATPMTIEIQMEMMNAGRSLRKSRKKLRRRSEERRVGKECRSRWSRYHEKKEKTI